MFWVLSGSIQLPPHLVNARRNVEEDTITGEDLRRDYMAILSAVPCVVGEDKALESLQQVCSVAGD